MMVPWAMRLADFLRAEREWPVGQQVTWTLLRVVAGVVMIHNGLDKLADIPGFAEAYVQVIGLPFPIFFSYAAAWAELAGSVLVILGLATRPAALSLVVTMAVAIYHHIKVAGFGIAFLELPSLYAACFLLFTVNGAGPISLDHWLGERLTRWLQAQRLQKLDAALPKTPVGAGRS
ncbi:MAG: DoxX family protein [Gloeomargarita sp. SKYBB_i_bin120]|nr:DoxX family protein [Gloeomargarita sp. SKYG98]MCS7291600.1 DoxX family protein [Gloeomargarita sp. SKYB120]MDW8177160.1 DoxX family protein [Gloeomargarita sp. SKYBB_i_bin120]